MNLLVILSKWRRHYSFDGRKNRIRFEVTESHRNREQLKMKNRSFTFESQISMAATRNLINSLRSFDRINMFALILSSDAVRILRMQIFD